MTRATFQPAMSFFLRRSPERGQEIDGLQIFSKLGQSPFVGFRQPLKSGHRKGKFWQRLRLVLLIVGLVLLGIGKSHAQSVVNLTPTNLTSLAPFKLNVGVESGSQDVDVGIKILFTITLLTLAPSIILLMTCFTRIVIVLSFVRTALSLQGTPANQIIIGLSLFITFFIMAPVWEKIDRDAIKPYQAKTITGPQALDSATVHIRSFMLKQARAKDVELFVALAKLGPTAPDQLPLKVVIPGFIISELRTAFQMGFLLFVPFILIDLVVATVLMSLGMMMMPPQTISLPLKILLFVLVDGWGLVVRSLVQSFAG
jgi:flagellar biosynthetic protein FliP